MPLILGSQSAVDTGFAIDNSCRFNDADAARLSRANGTSSNEKIGTISFWLKLGIMGIGDRFILDGRIDSSNRFKFALNANDVIEFWGTNGGSTDIDLSTNRKLRDPAAWMHIVMRIDTTQASENDRARLYINGVDERTVGGYSVDTIPAQDSTDIVFFEDTADLYIGTYYNGTNPYDGYLADVIYCDGQSYAPTEFGEYDEDSPTIWKPKNPSGLTFGNNGFYIDFHDSADLGNDISGNNNDFTNTNLTATDQTTDTPTNNFCTLNPLDNFYASATFSEGNCKIVTEGSGTVYAFQTGTMGVTAGKWYWEMKYTAGSAGGGTFLYGAAAELPTSISTEVGHTSNAIGLKNANVTHTGDADTAFGGTTYTIGDIMGCALDMTNSRIFFSMNGVWMQPGSATGGDPTDGTGNVALPTAVASTPIGAYFPAFGSYVDAAQTYEVNFGNPSFAITSGNADGNDYGNFEYAVPSGYLALCTKNLGSDGG